MRIRFRQTFGAHAGRVLERSGPVIRFGRQPDSDVAFDPHADIDASGRHAEVRREGAGWVVVDAGSRNGTFVDGARVTRQELSDGCEIEFGLGGPRVRVELDPAPDEGVSPYAATAAMVVPGLAGIRDAAAPRSVPATARPPPDDGESGADGKARRLPRRSEPASPSDPASSQHRGPARRRSCLIAAGAVAATGLLLAIVAGLWVVRGPFAAEADPRPLPAALRHAVASLPGTPCVGFPVRRDLLATTATCVVALGSESEGRARVAGRTVAARFRHPGFAPDRLQADVGLVQVAGEPMEPLSLASAGRPETLRALAPPADGGSPAAYRTIRVRSVAGGLIRYEPPALAPGTPLVDGEGAVVAMALDASRRDLGWASAAISSRPIRSLLIGLEASGSGPGASGK